MNLKTICLFYLSFDIAKIASFSASFQMISCNST